LQKVTGQNRNLAGRKTDEAYGREDRKYLRPREVEDLTIDSMPNFLKTGGQVASQECADLLGSTNDLRAR
jgi:hypothetical protein